MKKEFNPHPLNSSDGFYVENDCCTACDVPFSEAPELFAYDDEMHCYVKRQPENESELEKAIAVTWMAELECIRYGGSDDEAIRRIAELGLGHLCDSSKAHSIKPVFRNHVTFASSQETALNHQKLAFEFKEVLAKQSDKFPELLIKPIHSTETRSTLEYSWYEKNFHDVNFSFGENRSRYHIYLSGKEKIGSRSVAMEIYEWISNDLRFNDFRWYSETNWQNSGDWQTKPY